jgi:hypothetical protein
VNRDNSFKMKTRWARTPLSGEKDVAEIGIYLGDRALTQLLDVTTNQVRDFIRASAVSLGLWFADNWWRLRWEPIPDYRAITADWRLRHELTSAPGGTTWPPLMIYGVGARVVLAPIAVNMETGGLVEYRPVPVSIMPGQVYEEGLDAFFKSVMATCANAQDGLALTALVGQLETERRTPEVAAWRRLEARLGYDPDTAPEGVIENLSEKEERLGADAVEEAAVGCPGARAPEVLEQAVAASLASEVKVDLAAATAAAEPRDHTDLTRPTWVVA